MINTLLKRRMENTKKNKKGFTLVELIVVLVIIAILAAVLVPTMSGYIGKAKRTAAQTACKNVVTAGQSAGTTLLGDASGSIVPAGTNGADTAKSFDTEAKEVGGSDVLKGISKIAIESATGSVTYVEYTDGTYSCVYHDGKYSAHKGGISDCTPAYAASPTSSVETILFAIDNGEAKTATKVNAATASE